MTELIVLASIVFSIAGMGIISYLLDNMEWINRKKHEPRVYKENSGQ